MEAGPGAGQALRTLEKFSDRKHGASMNRRPPGWSRGHAKPDRGRV